MNNKLRRSMLYIPANNPAMIQDAFIYGADTILFDLEDSIAISEKDAARELLIEALNSLNFNNTEIAVRINSLDSKFGLKDLKSIVPIGPDIIRIPKIETKEQIIKIDKLITKLERKANLQPGFIEIMAMIETAKGVLNLEKIVASSERLSALTLGAEDLTTDMGIKRTSLGRELFLTRSKIALVAAAYKINAIDTVFSDFNDLNGLKKETLQSKELGFTGKAVIHPRQVDIVNHVFTPSQEEIEDAKEIVRQASQAEEFGKGVIAVKGKMVDLPILNRAKEIINKYEKREVIK